MSMDQKLPRALARDLSYRERWGLTATLRRKLIERLDWTAGFHIYGIYCRPMVAPARQDPVIPGYCARLFRRGDEQELLACAKRPELELDPAFVHAALGKGDVCAAVLRNGQIVAFDWTAFTPTRVCDSVHVDFDRSFRYGYFAYTLPEYRGHHLARLVMPQRDRYILEQGRTLSIAYISVDNEASLRRSAALGSRRVGFAGYLKKGPVFVPFRTEGVREHGFRFFKLQQPT
jgi:GNAT superfamily N-acetyltransferase